MGVAHVGLVHCDPCKCKVKGFRAVSSIERNVSNRRHLQGVRQYVGFILISSCEYLGAWFRLWVRSGVKTLRSDVSRLVFLGKVELGVQKLGHRCALKLWKGSNREPGEDKEGIWVRV